MRRTELVELADLAIDIDFLDHGRIAGGDRLDLGMGQRAASKIVDAAHRGRPFMTWAIKRALVSSVCHI